MGACVYCGEEFSEAPGRRKTKDHVIPKDLGGHLRGHSNLVAACRECNSIKGAMTPEGMLALACAADDYAARLRLIAGRVEGLMRERGLSLSTPTPSQEGDE